jgi:hypothetical protein
VNRPASPVWERFLANVALVQEVADERGGLVSSSELGFVLVAASLLTLAHELHGGNE